MKNDTINVRMYKKTRDRLKVKAAIRKQSMMELMEDLSKVNVRSNESE